MDFTLPAELVEFQELIREVAADQVACLAEEVDRTGSYPEAVFEIFRDVGLLGLCIPAEQGGSGAGLLGLALAIEEVAKVSLAAAMVLELARLSAGPVMSAGTSEQKQGYLAGIADGSQRGAVALYEQRCGFDVSGIRTTAERDPEGTGGWVLSGTKCSVAGVCQADWFAVFAKTDGAENRARDSVSAFLVERSLPGVSLGKLDDRTGIRGVDSGELVLDQVRVVGDCVLGDVGGGLRLAMLGLNLASPLAAARAVGLAEAALMAIVESFTEPEPGTAEPQLDPGGAGWDQHQNLRCEVASLAADVEAVRLLTYRAAWMVDVGQIDRQWSAQLALANHRAADLAVAATALAAKVARGPSVERWVRDAVALTLPAGSAQECLELIAQGVYTRKLWWGGLEL
ncbi:MAG: acyl-CoA dehydrogenase family protein [Acidimicrobiales bacterium]